MSDYKLVPVEPTLDMLCEGTDVYGREDCAETDVLGIYKAMIAVAPDLQGERVGWQYYQDGKWWHGDDRIKDHRKNTEEAGFRVRDVYAATQPLTEEKGLQPAKNPPPMPQVKPPKAEQQPDVSALVEALEACLEVEERPKIIELARAALAAHYKKGGEV